MRILLVNKFLYPKGGAETYVFKLGKMLRDRGHQVEYFGMENPGNIVGNWVNSYVSEVDFSKGILQNLAAPLRIVYSREARRRIRSVLEDFQPDVVHVNNIQFHLTPSILLETEKYRRETGRRVKLVCTAHDYQMVCPSHGLFDRNIRPCEKCLGGNYTHCLRTKCVKDSYAKSFLAMVDAYFWKYSRAYSYLDTIICCSAFLKEKLDTQSRFAGKTVVLHNFMERHSPKNVEKGGYILEFGHLSRDKGTNTLLEAAKRMPEIRFLFAGYGKAVEDIKNVPNAEYVGFKTGEELEDLIRRACISVYPSEWHENCPFSVLESQMYGTPVIGSRMGGIPELIEEGSTGELFQAGNADELEQKIRAMMARLEGYTGNCRFARLETPETYYDALMRFYTE